MGWEALNAAALKVSLPPKLCEPTIAKGPKLWRFGGFWVVRFKAKANPSAGLQGCRISPRWWPQKTSQSQSGVPSQDLAREPWLQYGGLMPDSFHWLGG